MANPIKNSPVDPFDSDNIPNNAFHIVKSTTKGGDYADIVAPSAHNYPDVSPTRTFIELPENIDQSDLAGSRPVIITGSVAGDLTRVGASPAAGEYRIPNTTTSLRGQTIEINSAQWNETISFNYFGRGTAHNADINDVQKFDGRIGISNSVPVAGWALDIQSWQSIVLGADNNTDDERTNAIRKGARIGGAHYTNSELPVAFGYIDGDNTENIANIGGGTDRMNAVTKIKFYTAANTTTPTGTERMIITTTGEVGIGVSDPDARLDVAGDAIIGEKNGTPSYSARLAINGNFAVHMTGTDNPRIINSSFSGSPTTGAGVLVLYDNASGEVATINLAANGDSFFNGGNLGIGLTNPAALLDVNGNAIIAGTLTTGEIGNNTTFRDNAPTDSEIFYSLANAVPVIGDVAMLSGSATNDTGLLSYVFAYCERTTSDNIVITLTNLSGAITDAKTMIKDDPTTTFKFVTFSAIKIK